MTKKELKQMIREEIEGLRNEVRWIGEYKAVLEDRTAIITPQTSYDGSTTYTVQFYKNKKLYNVIQGLPQYHILKRMVNHSLEAAILNDR